MNALTDKLIKLYFHVSDKYKEQICWEVQRFSNNRYPCGAISDEELITIYLFCVAYSEKYKIGFAELVMSILKICLWLPSVFQSENSMGSC